MVLLPHVALAHERWVEHTILHPLHRNFFRRLDPNMLNISLRIAVVMAVMLSLWVLRKPLVNFLENKLRQLRVMPNQWVHLVSNFLTDEPVEHRWFERIGEWAIILFLRSPALVLIYSTVNNSLVMPSYPLEPSTAAIFKYAQVILAIAIISQASLPFCGAAIFAMFFYLLYAYNWKIAVDVLPVLAVAIVYVSSPWRNSHLRAITTISQQQMRWVRIVLGFSCMALGYMKVYNHDLTIGVADNYPSVLEDPMIKLFYMGTDPTFKRECWVVAFGLSEVMTGFLVMMGVFNRLWSVVLAFIFSKLMLVDFGWRELPHLYPITAFLAIAFSNNLSTGFAWRIQQRNTNLETLTAIAASVTVVIFPMLYSLTLVEHP